jgi:pyruvate dehydrogenase E2 component (dihydrolipoamide acetyltransferase)
MIPPTEPEEMIDASGVAPRIAAMLPIGVRQQLRVRTLLAGIMLTQGGHRPAHLTRVRDALTTLPEPGQVRLGVIEQLQHLRAVIDAGVGPDAAAGGPAVESADIAGRRISYVGTGQDGDVVLLVHGYGGDRNSWLFLQEPLAARHQVYALDLPGHGTSAKDVGDGSIGTLASTVLCVLDAIGAERAHLVGHSLGGAVAVAAAARDPGRISSLTLIAPSGFGPAINAGYLRGFANAQTRRELKPVVGQLFADESLVTRQVVDDLLAYKRLDGVEAALHTLVDTLLDGDTQRGDSAAAMAAIGGAMPVTVVWGSADRIIPAAQAGSVAGVVSLVLDGAGHMPHMERPLEVQAAIEETIARAM